MKEKNLGYSLKNIPIPARRHYLKFMIEKVNRFITRLGWANKNLCYEFDSYLYSLMIVNTHETFSC